MLKIHLIMLLAFLLVQVAKAQIPTEDLGWIKDTTYSDDFSGTSLKTYKWTVADSVPDHGLEMMFKRNVTVSGGTVKIKVDTLDPNRTYGGTTYKYQSGTFRLNAASAKFGYLEMSAKLPVGHRAYWPAFWVWNGTCTIPKWYDEVDIAEYGPDESINKHQLTTNTHMSNPSSCNLDLNYSKVTSGLPRLDSTFHKYALQWDADGLTFYFDDVVIDHQPNSALVPTPQHFLYLVFDIYVYPWDATPWPHMPPAYFEIDYFNYYKLNIDCTNALTISDPSTNYYTTPPARAVKQSITTGTVGASSPTFNLSDKCTLRATDYILLDAGTTINGTGSGQFSVVVTPCPN